MCLFCEWDAGGSADGAAPWGDHCRILDVDVNFLFTTADKRLLWISHSLSPLCCFLCGCICVCTSVNLCVHVFVFLLCVCVWLSYVCVHECVNVFWVYIRGLQFLIFCHPACSLTFAVPQRWVVLSVACVHWAQVLQHWVRTVAR